MAVPEHPASTPRSREKERQSIVETFHALYYDEAATTWARTFWRGHPVLKCPLDLWIYQEILVETTPDLIVETGTFGGGSAFFLASICDLLDQGEVVTIDIDRQRGLPDHPRITYVTGSSVGDDVLAVVAERAKAAERVMVILDSDHSRDHVLRELELYGPLVTPGGYLIVEDTNVNGHPVLPEHGPGPMEAVTTFLETSTAFEVDRSREKLLFTFNPSGYLRRREPQSR